METLIEKGTESSASEGPRVAMFADAFAKEPREAGLDAILESIRTGRWRNVIEPIRHRYADVLAETQDAAKAKDAIADAKKRVPAFTMSGTANGRREPLTHSGVLQIDLDHLGEGLPALREKLKHDPHVAFGFISPSGDGLKLGLRIDGARHGEAFAAAQNYFKTCYGLEIDPAVKDRLRLCFVSNDPDLWRNETAEPLPIPEAQPAELSEPQSIIILPSGEVTISDSARDIFGRIATTHTMFFRGGALVELVKEDGIESLSIVKPEALRSRVERQGKLMAWRSGADGIPSLKPVKMPRDDANALMETIEARELLPPVAIVVRCPVLIETVGGDGAILGRGYHREQGGLLVVAGETPPQVELEEAANAIKGIISEYDFQTEGDRSRALAALITPALRMGGHLKGNVPIDVAEADQSQAGKGYRHELVREAFNETAYTIASRNGGVGGTDESFAHALVAGRPFIGLDNLRGNLDSQNLESFLTCPGLFPARLPYHGEVLVNPKRFLLQLSSNGMSSTRDLANRSSICRIKKRPGFAYRDTLGEIQKRQQYFLGCVFSIVAEWIAHGKPRTSDTRHDFREWAQVLDWIVQNLFHATALMDGHEAAQERVSNPALTWLRAVALALEREGRTGTALIASELVETCDLHSIEIAGLKDANEDTARRQVGCLMRRIFGDRDSAAVEGFTVLRTRREYRKPSGDLDSTPAYTFQK
jgi:hypothetical protein